MIAETQPRSEALARPYDREYFIPFVDTLDLPSGSVISTIRNIATLCRGIEPKRYAETVAHAAALPSKNDADLVSTPATRMLGQLSQSPLLEQSVVAEYTGILTGRPMDIRKICKKYHILDEANAIDLIDEVEIAIAASIKEEKDSSSAVEDLPDLPSGGVIFPPSKRKGRVSTKVKFTELNSDTVNEIVKPGSPLNDRERGIVQGKLDGETKHETLLRLGIYNGQYQTAEASARIVTLIHNFLRGNLPSVQDLEDLSFTHTQASYLHIVFLFETPGQRQEIGHKLGLTQEELKKIRGNKNVQAMRRYMNWVISDE